MENENNRFYNSIFIVILTLSMIAIWVEVYLYGTPDYERVIKLETFGIELTYNENLIYMISIVPILITILNKKFKIDTRTLNILLFLIPLSFLLMTIFISLEHLDFWITLSMFLMSLINFYFLKKNIVSLSYTIVIFIISAILLIISPWLAGIVHYLCFYSFFILYTYSVFYHQINNLLTDYSPK